MSVTFREDSIIAGKIEDLKAEIAAEDHLFIEALRAGETPIEVLRANQRSQYEARMEKMELLVTKEKQAIKARELEIKQKEEAKL